MRLLFPGEPVGDFVRRPGFYKRLRYRLRLALWGLGAEGVEPEWHLLPLLVDPTRAAIDVGANYGAYAGALCRLTRRVHCFEPFPALAEQLRRRLPPWAIVHAAAASDHSGETTLMVPLKADGSLAVAGASIDPNNREIAAHNRVERIRCPVVRLDEAVSEPVGFIKIDVEGHELATLRGAERILREDRPVLLIESVRQLNASAPFDVADYLRARCYHGVFLWSGRLHALEAFRPDVHQPLLAGGSAASPFAWNFIFLPGPLTQNSGSAPAAS